MSVDVFLIFSLGFFLFCMYMCLHENRRAESRKDYRNDLEYTRTLNERREFGYQQVEESIRALKPRRFRSK